MVDIQCCEYAVSETWSYSCHFLKKKGIFFSECYAFWFQASMCDVIWVNQQSFSSLSPGLHLNITEGSPLSDLDSVNTLLNGNGYFNVWCNMSKPAVVIFSFPRSASEYYWRLPSVWPGFCKHVIEWERLLLGENGIPEGFVWGTHWSQTGEFGNLGVRPEGR